MDRAHCPQGLFSPFFTFLRALFSARLDFPSAPLSAPGSPRMDLHLNGNNLADKNELCEMLDLNVVERYSELEDESERSPEYADHLAKLLAEKESLSDFVTSD